MKSALTKFAAIGECMLEFSTDDAEHYQLKYAGDTFNTSLYLARYANDVHAKVDYITVLGEDQYSNRMLQAWQNENIGTQLVAQIPNKLPGLYLIQTEANGERHFYFYRQQAAAKQLLQTPLTTTMLQQLPSYDYIYLSSISFAILSKADRKKLLQALQHCQHSKIIFDPNYRAALWPDTTTAIALINQILPLIDIGLPTLDNEQEIFSDHDAIACAKRWHDAGVNEVVVKQGEQPCLVSTKHNHNNIAAENISTVIDTTAAGDSFNAAYIAARISGLPPIEAAKKGHQLAAAVIQQRGAIIGKTAMPMLFNRLN